MMIGVHLLAVAPEVTTMFDQGGDAVMDALLALEPILGFSSSAVGMERSTGKLWIDVAVEADSPEAAIPMAMSYIRTALGKAGILSFTQHSLEAVRVDALETV